MPNENISLAILFADISGSTRLYETRSPLTVLFACGQRTLKMNFGAIIIGDELLSGRRPDRHFQHVIERWRSTGWNQVVPHAQRRPHADRRQPAPDPAQDDIVFSSAASLPAPTTIPASAQLRLPACRSIRHPEAVAEIEARFGAEACPRAHPDG